ncbi:MAG: hypothetical protein R2710_25220 [Acidimicrobiales bacterium]
MESVAGASDVDRGVGHTRSNSTPITFISDLNYLRSSPRCGSPAGTSTRFAPATIEYSHGSSDTSPTWSPSRKPSAPTTSSEALAGDYLEQGYEWAHWGHDHWNGVAIPSRVGLEDEQRGFRGHNRSPYDQARLLTATCGTGERQVRISSSTCRTVASSMTRTTSTSWCGSSDSAANWGNRGDTLLLGDFNVAPADIDIYDPPAGGARPHVAAVERAAIEALLDADFGGCDSATPSRARGLHVVELSARPVRGEPGIADRPRTRLAPSGPPGALGVDRRRGARRRATVRSRTLVLDLTN